MGVEHTKDFMGELEPREEIRTRVKWEGGGEMGLGERLLEELARVKEHLSSHVETYCSGNFL